VKIKETIERECCDERKDLKPLPGCPKAPRLQFLFCVHCGRWWEELTRTDGAGSRETYLAPLPWPWVK
jgi:hypothetical protein